jgi:hypothetical protein
MMHLKKVYKNKTLFEWEQCQEQLRLSLGYLIYLIKRVLKAKAGKY